MSYNKGKFMAEIKPGRTAIFDLQSITRHELFRNSLEMFPREGALDILHGLQRDITLLLWAACRNQTIERLQTAYVELFKPFAQIYTIDSPLPGVNVELVKEGNKRKMKPKIIDPSALPEGVLVTSRPIYKNPLYATYFPNTVSTRLKNEIETPHQWAKRITREVRKKVDQPLHRKPNKQGTSVLLPQAA